MVVWGCWWGEELFWGGCVLWVFGWLALLANGFGILLTNGFVPLVPLPGGVRGVRMLPHLFGLRSGSGVRMLVA